jgi:O-acetyl-ADP-ribose deacetylase (regulator of RNase III)
MGLIFVSGDLLASKLPAVAHGCNCLGVMGAGIAKEFKKRWPAMYQEYRRKCHYGEFNLGDVFPWVVGDLTIYNLATQQEFKADIKAIQTAITSMLKLAEAAKIDTVGIPRIGAGLGGLEWNEVKWVLQIVEQLSPVTIVVFEDFVAGKVWERAQG